MDATTTPSTNSLINSIQRDFKEFHFQPGHDFQWDASTKTVYYSNDDDHFEARLLHELSHAILAHTTYDKDIDLIALERDAWQYARATLAPTYSIHIDTDTVENDMDTYRDWLHARSQCPKCESTGLQIKKNTYKCLACAATWRVNEARICALRRYTT